MTSYCKPSDISRWAAEFGVSPTTMRGIVYLSVGVILYLFVALYISMYYERRPGS